MKDYDERAWEIEISRCDDGDLLLTQGIDGCGDETVVRLHRCHFQLVAEYMGFVRLDALDAKADRLSDRLRLMLVLINAHTKDGDPLRVAATALLNTTAPPQDAVEATVESPRSHHHHEGQLSLV